MDNHISVNRAPETGASRQKLFSIEPYGTLDRAKIPLIAIRVPVARQRSGTRQTFIIGFW